MKTTLIILLIGFALLVVINYKNAITKPEINQFNKEISDKYMDFEIKKSEEQWKAELGEERYYVLRQKGTERPFTGKFNDHYVPGKYTCGACGEVLFTSDTKFNSHCGWPSFYDAIDPLKIKEIHDNSHGMKRIEVVCAKCGGHLGHVFPDGPKPTGLRYCINSVSLDFIPADSVGK